MNISILYRKSILQLHKYQTLAKEEKSIIVNHGQKNNQKLIKTANKGLG